MSRKLSPWCKKVKKKLIDLDMTTTELAEVIGLSRGHVSAVVNGRSYSANTVSSLELQKTEGSAKRKHRNSTRYARNWMK